MSAGRSRALATPIRASEIATESAFGVIRTVGDPSRAVHDAKSIGVASSDDIAFCTRDGEAGAALITASGAGIIVCTDAAATLSVGAAATLLVTATPRLTFARILSRYFDAAPAPYRHPTAWIHPRAVVADDVVLGPYVVIDEDCEIGAGCVLHAHVTIERGTRIGQRVILHAGVVIGADGFGHERNPQGTLEKFPQIGGVWIGDDVEIGANSCVSRGTLSDTIVESGVRMDNLVHIAHNVVVGRDAVLTANAMVAGSTRIGARAWIAPSAALMDGLTIGEDAVIGLGAVVIRSVDDHAVVAGNPAKPLVKRVSA